MEKNMNIFELMKKFTKISFIIYIISMLSLCILFMNGVQIHELLIVSSYIALVSAITTTVSVCILIVINSKTQKLLEEKENESIEEVVNGEDEVIIEDEH